VATSPQSPYYPLIAAHPLSIAIAINITRYHLHHNITLHYHHNAWYNGGGGYYNRSYHYNYFTTIAATNPTLPSKKAPLSAVSLKAETTLFDQVS
jgi:hypothetical protein